MQALQSHDIEADAAGGTVRKRHVLFVPGYDPIVPRRYRELYRREALRQAAISGYEISVEGRTQGEGNYCWDVWCRTGGAEVTSRMEFLAWEDIVKSSMNRTIFSSFLVMIRTVFIYVASGAFFRLVRLRPQPMLAALYPVIVLLAQLEAALLLFAAIWWAITSLAGLPSWAGIGVGLAGFAGLMTLFYRLDNHVFAYYLINDYGFTAKHWGATPKPLADRIDVFAARIAEVCATDVDEVLVVGHSTGAQIAAMALAKYLRNTPERAPTALSFLSLGQVIPMLSFLPRAQRLRGDLSYLSQSKSLSWIDISAPGDGGCFALSDPVHVTGVAPPEHQKRWPKVVSAAYSQTLAPEVLAKTKWRFFRRHIQYLCAFEHPRDYEYFQITAGPITLNDRFAWRGATATRIETVLSGYRDF